MKKWRELFSSQSRGMVMQNHLLLDTRMRTALFLEPRAHAVGSNQLPLAEAGLFPLLRRHGRICSGHRPGILKCERTYTETSLGKVKESAIWGLTKSHQIPFTITPYGPYSSTRYWLELANVGSLFKFLFNDISPPVFKPWRTRYESLNYGISSYWST